MIELTIDPEFQELIPPLAEPERKQLEENILAEGIRDPICVWEDVILDGHHRYQIAKKHNLDFEIKEYMFDSKEEAKLWMIRNQMGRRNLNRYQAVDLVLEFEDLIAAQVRKETGKKSGMRTPSGEEIVLPDKKKEGNRTREVIAEMAQAIAGGDRVGHGTVYHLKEAKEKSDPETYKKILDGKIPLSKVSKAIRKEAKLKETAERQARLAKQFKRDDSIKIYHADFYKWCNENLEPGSVDLILTDPPYPKEFLHVWEQLSEVASKVLKPGGYLISYSGQLYLNKVMVALEKHLEYCWMIALHHSQNSQLVNARQVVCTWKPILIYRNGRAGQFESLTASALVDSFMDDFRDKDYHEWGQGHAAVAYLMRVFSDVGQLVLEPFAGGGTTLAVAKRLNRKCIGIEIEEHYINTIKANILKTEQEKLEF